MRLTTLKTDGGLRAVAVVTKDGADRFVDLQGVDSGLPSCLTELLTVDGFRDRVREAMERGTSDDSFVVGEMVAPIPRPGKVICIGLNYRDHAEESGMPIPDEPVCFSKFSDAVVGPDAEIRIPAAAKQVDYEAELVVVMGRSAKNVSADAALDYVAGYCNGHDVSARDWQIGRPGGQWLLGKTPATFAPIGPWLVTADEIADPNNLAIQLRLNGETLQDSSTKEFIFTVQEVIAYLSQIMTLQPGDIIFTGTPPGVGMARDPQVWLKPGDTAEVEIAGLGVLKNPVVAD